MMNSSKFTQVCEDVVVDILCRLPEKALARSKCICKAWNHFVNEICIPKYQINPPATCTMFLIKKDGRASNSWGPEERLKYVDMNENGPSEFIHNIKDLPFDHSADCLLDSCNGLFLFYTLNNYQYYVCNPTTKEFMLLPKECKHVKCFSAVLAFDPRKSIHFKVVCFKSRISIETELLIEIYDSKSFKWDIYTVPLSNDPPIFLWLHPLFYFGGKVYINSKIGKALCLDLTLMTISRIVLPEFGEDSVSLDFNDCVLGTLIGRLCYSITTRCNTQLKIWFFDDNQNEGSKWVLKHSICMLNVKELASVAAPSHLPRVFPFGFNPSCDIVYVGTAKTILSYEFKNSKWKKVISMRSKNHIFTQPMFSHACCLISLDSINRNTPYPFQPSKSSEVIHVMQVDEKLNCPRAKSSMHWTSVSSEVYEKVVVDILGRLPEEALVRCKCICKKWNRLINETCIRGYSNKPSATCVVFVEKTAGESVERRKWLNYVDLNERSLSKFIHNIKGLPFDHSVDCLLDSCNGLLLFYTTNNYQYYVCNPTTKEFMLLPDERKYTTDCLSIALAFDPSKSVVQFKVVSLFCTPVATELRIEIYSSKLSQWDTFTVPLPNHPSVDMWLFPLVCCVDEVYINSICGTALCLNPTLRSSSQIRLPEYGKKKPMYVEYDHGVLSELNGVLRYTATSRNNTRLKVWLYCGEVCESSGWTLLCNISMLSIKKMMPHASFAPVFPYGLSPRCEIVYVGTGSVILSYDFISRKCKEVLISTKPESRQFTHPMYSLVRCLVPLNSINTSTSNPVGLITTASWHD